MIRRIYSSSSGVLLYYLVFTTTISYHNIVLSPKQQQQLIAIRWRISLSSSSFSNNQSSTAYKKNHGWPSGHQLKLERYREDQHGPCARMTRTIREEVSHFFEDFEVLLTCELLSRYETFAKLEVSKTISNCT